ARRAEHRRWQGGLSPGGFPLAFSPDGRYLAAAAADGSIDCHPLRPRDQAVRLERAHLDGVGVLGWDAAGRLLSVGELVGGLEVWDLVAGRVERGVPGPGRLSRAFLTEDGRSLVTLPPALASLLPAAGPVVVWDVATGRRLGRGASGRNIFWARLSPGRRWL